MRSVGFFALVVVWAVGSVPGWSNPVDNNSVQVIKSSTPKKEAPQFRALLDTPFLLVGGVGAYAEVAIHPNITVGPTISIWNSKSTTDGIAGNSQAEARILNVGARGRYFLFGEHHENAVYMMGGLTYSRLDANVRLSSSSAGATQTASAIGPAAGAGAQLVFGEFGNNSKIVTNIGLTYGPGMGFGYTAQSSNGGPTRITEVSVNSGLFFELGVGVLF